MAGTSNRQKYSGLGREHSVEVSTWNAIGVRGWGVTACLGAFCCFVLFGFGGFPGEGGCTCRMQKSSECVCLMPKPLWRESRDTGCSNSLACNSVPRGSNPGQASWRTFFYLPSQDLSVPVSASCAYQALRPLRW